MSDNQLVVLVDESDNETGVMDKLEAHRKGLLHRAFSVFILNRKGEMLLQQRVRQKYHSGGLWTNACCSHPMPGESILTGAERRLQEEMGFCTPLQKIFDFTYHHDFENGLTEFEFDHVFIGWHDGEINPNKEEVLDFCFKSINDIEESLLSHPQKYTAWFHIAFPRVVLWLKQNSINIPSQSLTT